MDTQPKPQYRPVPDIAAATREPKLLQLHPQSPHCLVIEAQQPSCTACKPSSCGSLAGAVQRASASSECLGSIAQEAASIGAGAWGVGGEQTAQVDAVGRDHMVLGMRLLGAVALPRLVGCLPWTGRQRSQGWTAGETQERAAFSHRPAARDRSAATSRGGGYSSGGVAGGSVAWRACSPAELRVLCMQCREMSRLSFGSPTCFVGFLRLPLGFLPSSVGFLIFVCLLPSPSNPISDQFIRSVGFS